MPNITNITPPRVPLTDPRTGLISREWYLFLLSLFNQTGQSTVSLEDVQKGPPTEDVDLDTLFGQAQLASQGPEAVLAAVAKLATDVQALALAPANTPQKPRLRYGSFYDTTTQIAAVINTAYAITFNSTDMSQGVYRGTPTSRIYVDTPNVYDIQFSAQLDKTSGGTGNVWIWLRKNGADVANTASQIRMQGNDAEQVAAWNFLLDMNAGDYFELMWEVDAVDIQITTFAATAVHPAVPSVILTVTDNIRA